MYLLLVVVDTWFKSTIQHLAPNSIFLITIYRPNN